MKAIGIIPARLKSTRFPEKIIANLLGKPLIQWVYEEAKEARYLEDLLVAADEQKIVDVVQDFGGKAVLTSKEHKNGTERAAEVAASLDADIIVNIQGDEPLISPLSLDNLVSAFYNNSVEVATLIYPIQDKQELKDPNIVKVVIDKDNFALYFSRAGIPYFYPVRSNPPASPVAPDEGRAGIRGTVAPPEHRGTSESLYKHIGVYAYRKDFLLLFNQLPYSKLEKAERLEQLRILENGYKIKTVLAENDSISVDTEEDLRKVEEILCRRNGLQSDN